jgi:hypothetical protein
MRLGAERRAEAAADASVAIHLELEAAPWVDAARLIEVRVDVLERLACRAVALANRLADVGEAEPVLAARGRISTIGGPFQCVSGNCWSACIIVVAARM